MDIYPGPLSKMYERLNSVNKKMGGVYQFIILKLMQHVEFFHRDHFEDRYHRKKASGSIAAFIDYFWETDFEELYKKYPDGFSDALFPNIGYTYLINLGTPFIMQLEDERFEIKSDAFLPRHCPMICHHSTGNKIFGIKFKVSPVVFERNVNFAEYREYIFPLAYLLNRNIISQVKKAVDFNKRVEIISDHYKKMIEQYDGSLKHIDIVVSILDKCYRSDRYDFSVDDLAKQYNISSRTLQRYFEKATSINSKKALQIIRIRKVIEHLISDPSGFNYEQYGYYDHSHFYKHLRHFIKHHEKLIPGLHLKLLQKEKTG